MFVGLFDPCPTLHLDCQLHKGREHAWVCPSDPALNTMPKRDRHAITFVEYMKHNKNDELCQEKSWDNVTEEGSAVLGLDEHAIIH